MQPEQRAPVDHQVEFHIPAAPQCLEGALTLAIRGVHPPSDDGQVCLQKMITHAARQRKGGGKVRRVQVVEENPANAACLVAMLQEEVFIAPGLHGRIMFGAEGLQCIEAGLVKMPGIFHLAVVGREVHAATEPPHVLFVGRGGHGAEEAHVHVHRGHVGVARMQHQRHPGGAGLAAGQFLAVGGGRGRHLGHFHVGEHHAAALQHVAVVDHAADAAPLGGRIRFALPGIMQEGAAVHALQPRHDAGLQPGKPGGNGVVLGGGGGMRRRAGRGGCRAAVHGVSCQIRPPGSPRWPMSLRYCMPLK